MHDKAGLNASRNLVCVGYNTTDEGGISSIQSFHEIIKLTLVEGGDSFATTLLSATTTSILLDFSGLTRVIIEAFNQKWIATIFKHLNNSVIQGILVLLKPCSQVVGHSCGIVDNSKVSIGIWSWVGLLEVFTFSQQVLMELGSKTCISGFGEK